MTALQAKTITWAALAASVLAGMAPARAVETSVSGRVTIGEAWRVQARDPRLLTGVNAAELGLTGYGSGGNADDANTNYGRGDAVSRVLKAWLDLSVKDGGFAAFARVKAWHDAGLLHDGRPWGNVASRYAPGAPLSDAGAQPRSRFSGVALQEAWAEERMALGSARLLGRAGLQTLGWGQRFMTPGGLESLTPRDMPALHRPGTVAQEMRVALPMLFGRLDVSPAVGLEAYYQTGFRPNALDMCGTIWSMGDYLAGGCDRAMLGAPAVSDRARQPLGAYMTRVAAPDPARAEFGFAVDFKPWSGAELGLHHARYNARQPLPSLRRSTRPAGPALVPGDPDGRNMVYFTEYPEGLDITAITFAHKLGTGSVYGEVSYRPRTPFMIAPGDLVPAFLSPTAPSLLRARANAVPPGGLFHGFDLYAMGQAQLGVQREFSLAGVPLSAGAEIVAKHTPGLPDQAVLRYGRADIFGVGPISGNCTVTTADAERQCSLRGYATASAWGYRLRAEARFPALLPGLAGSAGVLFTHDVKGWSGDLLLNEGRRTAVLALRLEYRQRYVADLTYAPSWGGDYNQAADRDILGVSVGVKF